MHVESAAGTEHVKRKLGSSVLGPWTPSRGLDTVSRVFGTDHNDLPTADSSNRKENNTSKHRTTGCNSVFKASRGLL